ncbi:hypothetical protein Q9295_07585 [Xinfangfangia sp. CPCC 101601]|uniref:O-antigen ligase domain-containing protein n=1 Tax=Pseudogemmobacter lacusdianii TaxID=3069608 RepID=A0ABU0VWU5_9RHOB|nr:hypothetical protein [Xinfangfangia sp. CPCC 101601]MDQ2066229.1 hypothetical protein [Xinfangfangia sp. CPCC 101601]
MSDPNLFAYLVLLSWPLVVWLLYRKLDPGVALIWTVLAGYLVLPPATAIDLPVVPDFTKDSLPILVALAISVFVLRDRISLMPAGRLGQILMLLFVLSPFFTVLTNTDPIPPVRPGAEGALGAGLPGMRIYDSIAAVANHLIYVLPLFLGRHYLARPQAARALLAALVAAGLAYSLPMLIESRLSPQMNVWVYGFFQHDFFQTIRQGGYRPVVFLPHGLWVAMLALLCLGAATVFLRLGPAEARPRQLMVMLYLLLMLVICKTVGVLVYAAMLLPLLLLAPPRWQVLAAAGLAFVVISYPLLRSAHLVPLDSILDLARSVSADRAWSLQFRIVNEELLLDRASLRPWFGWGGYNRNFILDPMTGRMNIADGAWIIQIGSFGWIGYIGAFGLLCLPLALLGREALARGARFSLELAGLALIFACNLLDLLPNGTMVPLTWLMAGALLGQAEQMRAARKAAVPPLVPVQAVLR